MDDDYSLKEEQQQQKKVNGHSGENEIDQSEETSSGSEIGDLKEDDLELIEHNLRGSRSSTGAFCRLVKKQIDNSVEGEILWKKMEETMMTDDDEGPKLQRKRCAEDLAKLFEDEDHLQPAKSIDDEEENEDNDLADFIEEDEEEVTLLKHKALPSKATISAKTSQHATGADFDSVFGRGLLRDIQDVFGDGTDYAGMLAEEDSASEDEEDQKDYVVDVKKADIVSSAAFDIPERLRERSHST